MKLSAVILAITAAAAAQSTYTATGVGCEPHLDHWHCPAGVAEPTTAPTIKASVDTVSATTSGVCEPHDDHWHCSSGVAEPTYAPSAAPTITSAASGSIIFAPAASESASYSHNDDDDHSPAVTAATCEPHNDHWHCPSGVAEPTTAPVQTRPTSRATDASGAGVSASASGSVSRFAGAGYTVGANQQGVMAIVLGAIGAFVL